LLPITSSACGPPGVPSASAPAGHPAPAGPAEWSAGWRSAAAQRRSTPSGRAHRGWWENPGCPPPGGGRLRAPGPHVPACPDRPPAAATAGWALARRATCHTAARSKGSESVRYGQAYTHRAQPSLSAVFRRVTSAKRLPLRSAGHPVRRARPPCPSRHGLNSGLLQDFLRRRCRYFHSQACQLTVDPAVSPSGILAGQPEHQGSEDQDLCGIFGTHSTASVMNLQVRRVTTFWSGTGTPSRRIDQPPSWLPTNTRWHIFADE